MSIVMARLDNRLLHGIVAAMWTPRSGATRVMVIDDVTADDPVKKDAMKMSKPAGTSLSIINRETAYGNFKSNKYEGQKVFVIANSLQIFLDLIEQGEKIGKLILGGTAIPGDAEKPDYIKGSERMYLNRAADVPVLQKIAASGTEVVVQYVPTDKAVPLQKLLYHVVNEFDASIIRLGDLEICQIPAELFSCFGLQIKAASKAKYAVIWGYTNDDYGYLVEEAEYDKCYEGRSTNIRRGEPERLTRELCALMAGTGGQG